MLGAIQGAGEMQVRFNDDHGVIGTYGNAIVACTAGGGSEAGGLAARDIARELLSEHPAGIIRLVVVLQGGAMPNHEARVRWQEMAREFSESMLAMAFAFEGQGLWTASLRMLAQTMLMTVPGSYPKQMFATGEEAAAWMCEAAGDKASFDIGGLQRGVGVLRQRCMAQAASA